MYICLCCTKYIYDYVLSVKKLHDPRSEEEMSNTYDTSVVACVRHILREEGVGGLYKVWCCTLKRLVWYFKKGGVVL